MTEAASQRFGLITRTSRPRSSRMIECMALVQMLAPAQSPEFTRRLRAATAEQTPNAGLPGTIRFQCYVVSWTSYPLRNVACPPRDEGHLQLQPNRLPFLVAIRRSRAEPPGLARFGRPCAGRERLSFGRGVTTGDLR